MKKAYVSPEAIKVNFEANDIITSSGVLTTSNWKGWDEGNPGIMSIKWADLIGNDNNQ